MATGRDNGGQENNIIQGIRYRYSMIINGFHSDRDFSLFLIAGIFVGIAGGINSTVFNNFLSDVYKLSAEARGIVEVPRELPGALIMLVLGLISSMGSVRSASLGMVFASIGMAGLGLLSPTFALMLVWMMTLSLGTHIFMPLSASIGMELSSKEQYGVRLGRFSAYNLAATIIGYAAVWAGFKYLSMSYQTAFIIAAVSYFTAALFLGIMSPQKPETKKSPLCFQKKILALLHLMHSQRCKETDFSYICPMGAYKGVSPRSAGFCSTGSRHISHKYNDKDNRRKCYRYKR